MNRITPYILLTATGLLLTLSGCREMGESPNSEASISQEDTRIRVSTTQFESNELALGTPEERYFPETLEVSGTIDVPPENRAVVSAVGGGFVKSITLLVGDQVRKGDLVVSLESPEFLKLQQQYLEAREQLPYLEAEYTRQKTMYEEKISSEKLFLQAESQYRTTLAQYNSLGQQLALLNISVAEVETGNLTSLSRVYAPISGSVTKVNVRRGIYVTPATEIVEIVDDTHLHLELNVYEKDISRLNKDQLIRFQLPEYSSEVYLARVHLIGSSIDENRTVKVHAHLENETETGFLVGMYVRATIELEGDGESTGGANRLLAVPESAVARSQGQNYVLLLDEKSSDAFFFRQIPVQTGRVSGGYIAISGPGLNPGSEVLSRGAFNLVGTE